MTELMTKTDNIALLIAFVVIGGLAAALGMVVKYLMNRISKVDELQELRAQEKSEAMQKILDTNHAYMTELEKLTQLLNHLVPRGGS